MGLISKLLLPIRDKSRPARPTSQLLQDAFKFWINECIEGDYYEFGVFEGDTFISAITGFERAYHRRQAASIRLGDSKSACDRREGIFGAATFHAFDSFEGLPKLSASDVGTEDFSESQFFCPVDRFRKNLADAKIQSSRHKIHKGFFDDLSDAEYTRGMKKAAVIWLDCDLYSSSVAAYDLITEIVQDGTILIIDDWYSFKGSKFKGPQLAFHEWKDDPKISKKYFMNEYKKEGWKRNSFIVNQI